MVKINKDKAAAESMLPSQSNRASSDRVSDPIFESSSTTNAATIPAIVGNAVTRNIDRHPHSWITGPATIGPAAAPIATVVVIIPRAFPRSLPGKTPTIIANTTA